MLSVLENVYNGRFIGFILVNRSKVAFSPLTTNQNTLPLILVFYNEALLAREKKTLYMFTENEKQNLKL